MKLKVGDQVWYWGGVHEIISFGVVIEFHSRTVYNAAQLENNEPVDIKSLKKYTPKIGRVRG